MQRLRRRVGAAVSAFCKSCGQRIEWATTYPNQRRMPIDAGSAGDPAGTVAVRREPGGGLTARYAAPGDILLPGEHRGRSHWASCPNAREHRAAR